MKDQAIINKELSYFDSDSEILFFPFSCFKIKQVEKIEDRLYKITLNYFEEPNEAITFENVPENDFSKMVFYSGIINTSLINMPSWFQTSNQPVQINPIKKFIVEKDINDFDLLSAVKNECLTSIIQSIYENNDQLRDIIQNNLKKIDPCNWWVQVGVEKLSSYRNINSDLVMIFSYYQNLNLEFYVHVAKLES